MIEPGTCRAKPVGRAGSSSGSITRRTLLMSAIAAGCALPRVTRAAGRAGLACRGHRRSLDQRF